MTIREMIMLECKNYKTNFENSEDLVGKANDYNEAKYGGLDFICCPKSYECLNGAEELCNTENKFCGDPIEECRQCWRNALSE